uniref:Uncharacterized protein n=1 Tax=Anguilla anguilla TaxID=7936 RepID=A0A0E9QV80_ANGAN
MSSLSLSLAFSLPLSLQSLGSKRWC